MIYSGSTGIIIPAELAWLPTFGNLQGSYKFGGWYDTSTAPDVVTDINGNPAAPTGQPLLQSRGRYGAYVNFFSRCCVRRRPMPPARSACFSMRPGPRRTATTDYQIAGGLIYTGPFASRPQDDIGFAVGTTTSTAASPGRKSCGIRRPRPGGGPAQRIRHGVSTTPTGRSPALQVRPNIQYVIDPGGTSANPNAHWCSG